MNISMRTTVHDLVRALRWQRSDLLDAVMVRKSFKEPNLLPAPAPCCAAPSCGVKSAPRRTCHEFRRA